MKASVISDAPKMLQVYTIVLHAFSDIFPIFTSCFKVILRHCPERDSFKPVFRFKLPVRESQK